MTVSRKEVKIILIAILVGGITFLHYFTEAEEHLYHSSHQGYLEVLENLEKGVIFSVVLLIE